MSIFGGNNIVYQHVHVLFVNGFSNFLFCSGRLAMSTDLTLGSLTDCIILKPSVKAIASALCILVVLLEEDPRLRSVHVVLCTT